MWRGVAIASALVMAGGCGSDPTPRTISVPKPVEWVADGAPDIVVGGPQGGAGQFAVECGFDHAAPDDPIVHASHPGFSHLHQFFGAVGVDADTSNEQLMDSATTCDQQLDRAAYWSQTLVSHGESLTAHRMIAYYRAGPGIDPTAVEAFPPGFMMVAGDAGAADVQPVEVVSWSCGATLDRATLPMDCSASGTLRLNVVFPDCWDGSLMVAIPGRRHVAYSSDGQCPVGYDVSIPQVHLAFDFPAVDPADLALSSGDIITAHADFWNGWDPVKFEREVRHCINRDLACSVVS